MVGQHRPSASYKNWAKRMKRIPLPPYDPKSPKYIEWCKKFGVTPVADYARKVWGKAT